MDKLKLKLTIVTAQEWLGRLEKALLMERNLRDGDTRVIDIMVEELKTTLSTLARLANEP